MGLGFLAVTTKPSASCFAAVRPLPIRQGRNSAISRKGNTMKYPNMMWGRMEALINIVGGENAVGRILQHELVVKAACLSKQVTTVTVGGVRKFIAKDELRTANVVEIGENFKQFFVAKEEVCVEAANIVIRRLEISLSDASILAELDERTQICFRLAHFFELLKKQSRGEAGWLHVNGYTNIAYIIGNDGNFWAVNARWDGYGWGLGARSVGCPIGWGVGNIVLAR